MIKALLRNIGLYAMTLFLLPVIIPGVKIVGGLVTYLFGGFVLTVMFLILKPIFDVLTFPLRLITFGLFSIFTNVFILYLLTKFVPNIMITKFTYPGTTIVGFSIPEITVNVFFAYVLSSIIVSTITGVIHWMIHE